MPRLTAFLFLLLPLWLAAEPVRVTTWNLQNFPSGLYNLRKPEDEPRNTTRAAEVIRALDPDVLLLQEVRDAEACTNLAAALAPASYEVLVCSQFRDQSGIPGFQQLAILAKRHGREAHWERWRSVGPVDPPRGFALAVIPFGGVEVAFYCVHLKSNLVGGGDRGRQEQMNILKRELSADQLASDAGTRASGPNAVSAVVVGGDLNTSRDDPLFVSERTLSTLESAGLLDCFVGIEQARRVTRPGRPPYPDQTFDYVLLMNARLVAAPRIGESDLSDHRPVTCDIEVGSPSAIPVAPAAGMPRAGR